jgi:hypothetical protein
MCDVNIIQSAILKVELASYSEQKIVRLLFKLKVAGSTSIALLTVG